MKKIIGLFVIGVLCFSCKQNVEKPIDYAVLSGEITNKTGDFTLAAQDKSFKEIISIGEDGKFRDTLKVKPGLYMFYSGRNVTKVYLENGSNIVVNADVSNFSETVSFTGKGSEVCNYLEAKLKKEKELKGEGNTFFVLEETEFKAKAKEIKSVLEKMVSETEGISEDFVAKEKIELHYAYLSSLDFYNKYHSYYAKKPDYIASASFLEELKSLDYSNEEHYKASPSYKNMVNSHIIELAQMISKENSISFKMANIKAAASLKNNYIRNDVLYSTAKMGITFADDVKAYYKVFIDACTNEDYRTEITETYNKLKTVAPGQPSPKFVDYENYAGGTTSLDDLKGKYVYIDIWATWCGPCKAEIPFLQKVEKKYHGKNIEFVSISVDKKEDHNKWKAMVKEKELGGIQLFTGSAFKTDFVEDYFVMGIPRFILIDPKGNIVKSSAPRPSDAKLIDLFNQLEI
ncbi:redoxin domain-containing protein [Cellulophaga geojensis KL-A]|uniref:Redoxin domain-containing protein n=1 Tax=Cellulophaga geojensis KL-A TaxID=1328323 RepID=A0ABP3BCA6_9FLAO|nr:TlpA disulfide reductase family protein [Cellulophaga geojensis]EWH14422.1 redoxin domain-containing protein [Cellulophaga geojensis KL-A]